MDNIKSSGDVSTEDDWLITEEMKSSVRGGDGEEELKEITIGDDDHVITGLGDVEDEKEDEDAGSDSDDYLDMETFEEDNLLDEEDVGELQQEDEEKKEDDEIDNIKLTRTYDVSITYDKYYQTPRVFLFGYVIFFNHFHIDKKFTRTTRNIVLQNHILKQTNKKYADTMKLANL